MARSGSVANAAVLLCALFCAATANAKPVRILILGDSLTAGYGLPQSEGFQARMQAALQAKGYDVRLVDAAVSGDTSAGGRGGSALGAGGRGGCGDGRARRQ